MKKIILVLISFVFSVSTYAQLDNAWQTTKTKVTEFTTKEEKVCPVYSSTPMAKVKRQPWEIEVGFNAALFPSNGPAQLRTDALSLELIHNMSSAFGVYLRYDTIRYDKYDYENSVYEKEWDNYSVIGGFHLYLTPVIRIFGGAGKVYAKDKGGGEPSLSTAIEKGLKYDIPLGGYKVSLVYKVVEATLSDENPNVEESTGTQSYSIGGIVLSIPFGYDE